MLTLVCRDAHGNHAGTRHSSDRAPARRKLADRYTDSLRPTVSRLNEDLCALAACCKAQDLRFAVAERVEVLLLAFRWCYRTRGRSRRCGPTDNAVDGRQAVSRY